MRQHLIFLTLLTCLVADTPAQDRISEITVGAKAKPAFRIDPIVQRITARRGQTINFEFEMAAVSYETNIEVQAVGLKQEVTGTILPDTEADVSSAITLQSPAKLRLAENDTVMLRGTLKVPNLETPFQSFGILVTDKGQSLDTNQNKDPDTSVDVKFITRYLLRIDVFIPGVRSPLLNELSIDDAVLTEHQGLPFVTAFVTNPTDAPLECRAQCTLATTEGPLPEKPFDLIQPIRRNFDGFERSAIRVLPHSRVLVEAPVPYPVFPGDYDLVLQIHERRRPIVERTFAATTTLGEFPGLESDFSPITEELIATPGNLTLSMQRGGLRYVPLNLTNKYATPVVVKASIVDENGEKVGWAVARPDSVQLNGKADRKILIGMGPDRDPDAAQYARIQLQAETATGESLGKSLVDLAKLPKEQLLPELEVGNIRWEQTSHGPEIVIPVKNIGPVHAILQGRMQLLSDAGQRFVFVAGFKRWVLPSEEDALHFRLKKPIPAGAYELSFLIDPGLGASQLAGKTRIEVSTTGKDEQVSQR